LHLKLLKFLGIVAVLIVLVAGLSGCRGQAVLVAGVDINQRPLSYGDSQDNITGFEIDMTTEAAKRAGMTARFVAVNWAQKEKALSSGKVNSLWGEISATPDEEKNVLFTKPYMFNNQVIIVSADSAITSKAELAGKELGVIKNSRAAETLKSDKISAKLAGGGPEYFNDYDTEFLGLESGQIDAVAVDETMGDYYINQNTFDYKILSGTLSSEQYSVGFRRNDSGLRNSIQRALDSMNKDGTSKALSIKWFGKDYTLR